MRFRALTRDDWRLVVEASILSAFVYVGVRTLSFGSLRRALKACSRRGTRESRDDVARIAWAVQAASRRIPGGRTCLVEALAADVMLRRRGYEPVLHLGIRKQGHPAQPLNGHAWVVCENQIVVGGVGDLVEYVPLHLPQR